MRGTSDLKRYNDMVSDGYTRSGCGHTKKRRKSNEFKIFKTFLHRELKSSNLVVEDRAYQCVGELIRHLGLVQRGNV